MSDLDSISAQALRSLREERGLSRSVLAREAEKILQEQTGDPTRTISTERIIDWETKTGIPKAEEVRAVARVLGEAADSILGGGLNEAIEKLRQKTEQAISEIERLQALNAELEEQLRARDEQLATASKRARDRRKS